MTAIFSAILGPLGKLLGMTVGLLAMLGLARKSGADAQRARQADADAAVKARVDEAVAQQPGDADELIDRLRKGGRL